MWIWIRTGRSLKPHDTCYTCIFILNQQDGDVGRETVLEGWEDCKFSRIPGYRRKGNHCCLPNQISSLSILAFPLHWPPFLQTHIKHCSAFSRLLNLLSQNEGLISLVAVCLEAIRARKSWLFLWCKISGVWGGIWFLFFTTANYAIS